MKSILGFVKTTLIGGLFAILPMVFVFELFNKALALCQPVAKSIGEFLPESLIGAESFPIATTVVLLASVCFGSGLVLRFKLARSLGHGIERYLLMYSPGYKVLKGLIQGMQGSNEVTAFKPALVTRESGERELACLIEDHGTGWVTVMIPSSPSMMSGSVIVIRTENVELLNVKLSDLAVVVGHWGLGTKLLLDKHATASAQVSD